MIVDDGSSDGTAALAEAAARRDGRMSLLRQSNRGVSSARNVGSEFIARDGTRWVMFLDSDDVLVDDAFEALRAALANYTRAVGAYGLAEYMDLAGRPFAAGMHSALQNHRLSFLPSDQRDTPEGFPELLRARPDCPRGPATSRRRADNI